MNIYAIIDRQFLGKNEEIETVVKEVIRSGVDIIQLRDKNSSDKAFLELAFSIKKLAKNKIPFIVNDRLDIAKIIDADGAHLGQDDIPIAYARKLLGPGKIIGKSCHCLAQALNAQKEAVDYICIGPIFQTALKPDTKPLGLKIVNQFKSKVRIPFFVIGGITLNNIKFLSQTGATRFAFCRQIIAAQNKSAVVKKIKEMVNNENTD